MVNIPVFVLCLSSISFSHVAAQIKQTKTDKFSSLCLRLSLWLHQVCFHGAITIIVLALVLASLVKTRLCSAFQVALRLYNKVEINMLRFLYFVVGECGYDHVCVHFYKRKRTDEYNRRKEKSTKILFKISRFNGLGLGVFIYFMNLSRTPSHPFLFIFFYMMANIS